MAYNPYSAVNAIYKLKGQWDTANNAGDTTKKNDAAAKAQEYYRQLRNNGYGDVADELTAADYTQAKAINDKWAKSGRSSTRDYLYSLGKSKGLSSSDIDKLISWDNDTGQVSFGGKVIGTPDAVVDGVSYWGNTSVLDNAFNDYIERSGTTRSKESLVNQENESLFAKYNQEYEDLKNTNPFTTEEAKAILAKYDLAGLQGRDNQVASGSASNGGNIDSFSAANALRQQSALVNQGQMAVLEAHQQKLDHARNLLSDMGVNIDRVFNEDETAKNNEVARKSAIAEVTGYAPDEWVASNNPYMNDDGTIKDEYKDVDFSDVMEKAKAAGNTEAYNAAAVARYYKIMGNYGLYGQYDDGNYRVPGQQRTANYDLTKQQIDSAERIAKGGNDTNLALADKEAQSALDQISANTQSQKDIMSYATENGLTVDTDGNIKTGTEPGSDGSENKADEIKEALDTVYADSSKTVKEYIRNVLEPYYLGNTNFDGSEVGEGTTITPIDEANLKQHLLNNAKAYDLEVDDIKAICEAFGFDSKWVDNYKNSGWFGWGSGIKQK